MLVLSLLRTISTFSFSTRQGLILNSRDVYLVSCVTRFPQLRVGEFRFCYSVSHL